jgi:RNA polymerase sigma-70 factor (ECF subfamily)
MVLAAGGERSGAAGEALENLCRTYWTPLYVYVRRRGYTHEDAQDLTQQFFAHFLQKDYFRLADPARGRFRSFLLRSLDHFLVNEWKRSHRQKRGGEVPPFSLDAAQAEQVFAREMTEKMTPEQAFEKRWALTLLERVLAALRQEYADAGQTAVFAELADHLWGGDGQSSFAHIGERLGLSEAAARGAMYRLRQRYRDRLRSEVAQTVSDYTEVDAELRHLIGVVSQKGES